MAAYITLIVALAGFVLYLLASNPKAVRIGEIILFPTRERDEAAVLRFSALVFDCVVQRLRQYFMTFQEIDSPGVRAT